MAILSITDQYYTSSAGPLDAKLAPVATYDDLAKIKRAHRYVGMTITVLDEMHDYWLSGGTSNRCWVKKVPPELEITGNDVN